jgi:alpha-tubulin suppressor-like RCC1 family protein
MFHSNRTTWTLHASMATVLCTALLTTGAMAASPRLQTIDVTPAAKTISVGQKQTFTATGTFSNGSNQALGPAIADIGPGGDTTCLLLTSGGVECWGYNLEGELGDGTYTNSLTPRPVKGITTATAIVNSGGSECALLASRAVKCWGGANLGNGHWGSSSVPVFVTGISTATAVAEGLNNACAVLASGAVRCWGYNADGELGDGTNTDSSIPVNVIGISTAIGVAVEIYHGCAVLASGAVQCWGANYSGDLGNGSADASSNTPVTVRGISNATAVAVGGYSSCALLATGAVRCWGNNYWGQLGDGSTTDSSIPVPVAGISTAVAITAASVHACAVLRSGSVKCWGFAPNDTTSGSNTPVTVQGIYGPTRLVTGSDHACALFSGGVVTCWGLNDYGQLGLGWRSDKIYPLPARVVGTPGVVWTSSDSSKATITDRGVATGSAVGNTTITATTAGFINDNAVLTVK